MSGRCRYSTLCVANMKHVQLILAPHLTSRVVTPLPLPNTHTHSCCWRGMYRHHSTWRTCKQKLPQLPTAHVQGAQFTSINDHATGIRQYAPTSYIVCLVGLYPPVLVQPQTCTLSKACADEWKTHFVQGKLHAATDMPRVLMSHDQQVQHPNISLMLLKAGYTCAGESNARKSPGC